MANVIVVVLGIYHLNVRTKTLVAPIDQQVPRQITPPFPSTGVNNHVTLDLASLDNSKLYHGNKPLCVGNGNPLPILNIGSSKVFSPNKTFTLSNVLHVPEIKRTSYFFQQFCLENHVFF